MNALSLFHRPPAFGAERLVLPPLAALALLLLAGAATGHAQSRREARGAAAADSIVQAALERARAGDTSAALDLLERATKVAPNYAPAHFERGVLLSRTTRLGFSDLLTRREATGHIKRALELDANNPFYLMELGRIRLKTPFLRLDAERLFNKALRAANERKDPKVLAEIHWELGQIHERRFTTMANRRMITGDALVFDPNRAIADWHYTADFLAQSSHPLDDAGELDARKAEDHFRAAILANPTHEAATAALLALLYDAGRYEEMVRTATELRSAQPMSYRLLFALGLALHRTDRTSEAQPVFDSALARLDQDERRDMLGLEGVLREEDAKAYRQLPEGARFQLDSLFWDRIDPLRLTPVNEARVEFLSRVAYADLRFSSPEFRTKGWRTDRGDAYIRYGPPPVVATFAPEVTNVAASPEAVAKVTTVWWYPESKIRFVFMGPPAMNYASYAGDFRAYAENLRYMAPMRLDNLKSAVRVDSVAVQIARFRGDSANAVDVSVFADIPTGRMLRDVDVQQSTLETALFITDGLRRDLVAARDSSVVRAASRERVTGRSWRRVLPPGQYFYRVEAREPGSGHNARASAAVELDAFPAGALATSDILVARRIVPREGAAADPRGRGDFLIVPNGSLTYAPDDTLFLYWENYGVTADSQGNGRIRIELALRLTEMLRPADFAARLLGGLADAVGASAEGDDRVVLRYERAVPAGGRDRVPNYLALALDRAPYGDYMIELTVTDLTTGRKTTRSRAIRVPRP
ncbi:MAG TPA: GWxTD domain-containing protein [Gemmatimonadaceae bacterium]|nr:GWxTD domain-containing protein [Gemmatimonadaceae bacterium]